MTRPAPPRHNLSGDGARLAVSYGRGFRRPTMEREGLTVESQTLWDQILAAYQHLEATFEALWQRQLQQPLLHVDETRWPDLSGHKKTNWSLFAATSPQIATYRILPSKSEKAIRSALSGYRGILVADGYPVYNALTRDGPDPRLANCWAHVLRRFRDIRDNFPKACDQVLGLMGELFDVEALVPGPFPGDEAAQKLRAQLRQQRSTVLLQKIRDWAFAQGRLPRSELGKAIRYMLKRWQPLSLFVEDPNVPLSNNAVERSLRGPVVGRKNYYGSKSKRGTEVAALFYTLLETAKLIKIQPADYLRKALKVAIETPGTVLLPHDLAN